MNINEKNIEVKQYRNDWALALMSQGIIVKLTINRWRGTARLSSDELGLKFNNDVTRKVTDQYISLGSEKLIPPDIENIFSSIESESRRILKSYSFPTVWGYFVPFTAFDAWEKANEEMRSKYFLAANQMVEQYYDIIDTVKNAYSHMALDVWTRLYPNGGDATQSFVSDFVNKVIAKIPDRLTIMSNFKYDTTYFVIPMPSIIEENLSRARKEERKREMEEFTSKLERETREKVAKAYLDRKQDLIDGFLESTVVSLRKYVAELCESVLSSLGQESKKREISRSHKERIKKTIKKVKTLNFYDDKEMLVLLNNLETEVDKFKGERDNNQIICTLQNIVDVTKSEFTPEDFNPSISTLDI